MNLQDSDDSDSWHSGSGDDLTSSLLTKSNNKSQKRQKECKHYGHDGDVDNVKKTRRGRKHNRRAYHLLMMSVQQQRIIYFCMYFSLAFAIFWSFVEDDLCNVIEHRHGDVLSQSNKLFKFNNVELFSMVDAYIELRGEFKFNLTGIPSNLVDSVNNLNIDINMTVALTADCNGVKSYTHKSFRKTECLMELDCFKNDNSGMIECNKFDIWSEYEDNDEWSNDYPTSWQYGVFEDDHEMIDLNTTVTIKIVRIEIESNINNNNNSNVSISDNAELIFVYSSKNSMITYFECIVRGILVSITVIILGFWICRLYIFRDGDLLPEQRWMIGLLIACIFYQDPFRISLLPTCLNTEYKISSISYAIGLNFSMVYLSLMIDSIREIQNILDVLTVSFEFAFYHRKIIVFTLSFISAIIFTVFAWKVIEPHPEEYNSTLLSYYRMNTVNGKIVFFSGVLWFDTIVVFGIWYFYSLFRARRELSKLPYAETRERQLSFRLFKYHTTVILVFLLIYELCEIIFETRSTISLLESSGRHIGTVLLISVYVYTLAFVYLPLAESEQPIFEFSFEFGIANLLCHISSQAYRTPSAQQLAAMKKSDYLQDNFKISSQSLGGSYSVADIINVEQYSLKFNDFIYNERKDVQCIVCTGCIWRTFNSTNPDGSKRDKECYFAKMMNKMVENRLIKAHNCKQRRKQRVNAWVPRHSAKKKYAYDHDQLPLRSSVVLKENLQTKAHSFAVISLSNHHNKHDHGEDNPQRNRGRSMFNFDKTRVEEWFDSARNGARRRTTMGMINQLQVEGINIQNIRDANKGNSDMVISFRGTASAVNAKLDMQWKKKDISEEYWYSNLPYSLKVNELFLKWVRPRIRDEIIQDCKNKTIDDEIMQDDKLINNINDDESPLGIKTVGIHGGFVSAFSCIRAELVDTILKFYQDCDKEGKLPRFFVTGHSLGGAIAQLCGLSLEILFGHLSPVFIVSYGSPRVGNRRFAELLKSRVPESYRIVNESDPVTTLPRVISSKKYHFKHGGNEMIINQQGSIIFAPSGAEKNLLPARNRPTHHLLDKYKASLNAVCRKQGMDHFVLHSQKSI